MGVIRMVMKLEWLRSQANMGALRLDIDLPNGRNHGGEELLRMALVQRFEDDEGQALGLLTARLGVGRPQIGPLVYYRDRDEYLTALGEFVHDWPEGWKVTTERVIRVGQYKMLPTGERLVYRTVGYQNLLALQKLSLLLGAISQYWANPGCEFHIDGTSVLHRMVDHLAGLVARGNRELAQLCAFLPDIE